MGVEIFDPGVPPIFGPPALSIGGVGLVRPDWVEFIQLSKGATETPVPEDTDGYGEMEPPCWLDALLPLSSESVPTWDRGKHLAIEKVHRSA